MWQRNSRENTDFTIRLFYLVFQTDGDNGEPHKGFHAVFNAITNDVQTTVDGATMSSSIDTDTTTLPQSTITVQHAIVPVKKTASVGVIIATSLGVGVAILIAIGLLIFFIKRKRSIPKTKIQSNTTDDSLRIHPIEASSIETHIESASSDLNNMRRNQDVYVVPVKKGFRKEEMYRESLTQYDSLHTARPKMNDSGENNAYNMATAVTDNVYDTNKKDDVMGNEYHDSMGRIAMSEPGGNELYDTATNNRHTSNDVIVPDGSYGIIL